MGRRSLAFSESGALDCGAGGGPLLGRACIGVSGRLSTGRSCVRRVSCSLSFARWPRRCRGLPRCHIKHGCEVSCDHAVTFTRVGRIIQLHAAGCAPSTGYPRLMAHHPASFPPHTVAKFVVQKIIERVRLLRFRRIRACAQHPGDPNQKNPRWRSKHDSVCGNASTFAARGKKAVLRIRAYTQQLNRL
jgi:hypothetical protein